MPLRYVRCDVTGVGHCRDCGGTSCQSYSAAAAVFFLLAASLHVLTWQASCMASLGKLHPVDTARFLPRLHARCLVASVLFTVWKYRRHGYPLTYLYALMLAVVLF